jgi:group II intron reverse transcriptase/maturase
MHNAETTLAIIQERGRKGLSLEGVYRRLYNEDLYLRAYGRIYRNAGATTRGSTDETVDGMSLGKIRNTIDLLRNERYRWTPVRRVLIPKKNGKTRPLGIPTWSDKLLQETMRSILEAYYEPQFSPNSHGFRPKKGCHTALKDIFHGWTGIKWFIEGDIKGCFDNIDHTILLSILREKFNDNRFLTLIENLLKAGYLEQWNYHPTLSGTPQGGIISPLLANIYLDKFDQFVEKTLIPEYTKGKTKKANPTYTKLGQQIRKLRENGASESTVLTLIRERRDIGAMNDFDPDYRRLRYIRYADDFLLGFDGPGEEAEEIKRRIAEFLRDNLKLELSAEKTLITHARTEKSRFLGYEISAFWSPNRIRGNGVMTLRMPTKFLEEKISRYKQDGKPIHRTELVDEADFSIIQLYGLEYRGIVQYYAFARNRHWLNRLHWVMGTSLLKTLARKHQSTVSKMARRFKAKAITKTGTKVRCVAITIERKGKAPLYAQFGGLSLTPDPVVIIEDIPLDRDCFHDSRNELIARFLADTCEICGSTENVEVHHIRKLADLKVPGRKDAPYWKRIMASRHRKTLVVCRPCHEAIHAGNPTRKPESIG